MDAVVAETELPAAAAARENEGLRRREWMIALAVAAAVVASRALLSDRRGFWLDEYYTLRAAQMNFRELIHDRLGAGHSPLLFFYARLGFLLGREEWMLRLSSALAGGAATLLVTGLAGALGLRFCLPALWGLCLLLPYWVTAGTEYRYMMPVIALTAGCGWAAVGYARRSSWPRGAGLAALLGLLLWTHGSAQFVALGLLGFLIWDGAARTAAGRTGRGGWLERLAWAGRLALGAWPVLAGLLLSVPLGMLARKGGTLKARQMPDFGTLFQDLSEAVFGNPSLWPRVFTTHNLDYFVKYPGAVLLAVAAWLAWRETRRRQCPRGWRLMLSLALGIPLAQVVVGLLVRQTQGYARYLASFSVPALLLLAVGWHAAWVGWPRRLYRWGLAVLVLAQVAGVALDRGELHREAIEWLIGNYQGEKVFVSTDTINIFALEYLGFPQMARVAGLNKDTVQMEKSEVRRKVSRAFEGERRGFVLLYHDRYDVDQRIDELLAEGAIAGERHFDLSGKVRLIALIRDKHERDWLARLKPPQLPWGPRNRSKFRP